MTHALQHSGRRFARLLAAAFAATAIAAPVAVAGTDTGIGMPAGRDDVVYAPQPAPTPRSGFHWGDAGIGAASILGALALSGGAMIVVRRRGGSLRTS